MKVTWYGHSCFGVEIDGSHLLFDPFITPNPKASHIAIDSIPADLVLVTHGHEDHLADAEAILHRTGATLISNFEIVTWFGKKGLTNAHPLNHGGGANFGPLRIEYLNAVHSSTLPDGSSGGNPGGFGVIAGERSFYVSGDTALHYDMKILGEMGGVDWAAMCIGDNFTMGFRGACMAAEWVGTGRVLGLHYDTFPPIEIDKDAALAHWKERGRELLLPAIGETVEF